MSKKQYVRTNVRAPSPLRSNRQRMIEAFNRNVRCLAATENAEAIDAIAQDILGHQLNASWGAAELASAVIALVPLASPDVLEAAVYDSIHHRIRGTTSREDSARDFVDAATRVEAKRLGVKFAPCGCLEQGAGSNCCAFSVYYIAPTVEACVDFYRRRGRVTKDEMATMTQTLACQPDAENLVDGLAEASKGWVVISLATAIEG